MSLPFLRCLTAYLTAALLCACRSDDPGSPTSATYAPDPPVPAPDASGAPAAVPDTRAVLLRLVSSNWEGYTSSLVIFEDGTFEEGFSRSGPPEPTERGRLRPADVDALVVQLRALGEEAPLANAKSDGARDSVQGTLTLRGRAGSRVIPFGPSGKSIPPRLFAAFTRLDQLVTAARAGGGAAAP